MNFADRLFDAVLHKKSPLVVGIDPDPRLIPSSLFDFSSARKNVRGALAQGVERFAVRIIQAVADFACAVKPQLAYFERLGPAGLEAYEATVQCAKNHGLLVIADGKRNDIAQTAKEYAAAYLGGEEGIAKTEGQDVAGWLAAADREAPKADALTVNPYLGRDSLVPFLERVNTGQGLFVLVKTSNPSSGDLQDQVIASVQGSAGEASRTRVYERVAAWLEQDNQERPGRYGYGSVGAVIGATYPGELSALRRLLPRTPFLVPGVGAQGAKAEDVGAAFDGRGLGAVVNVSRSILYAYREEPGISFEKAAAERAEKLQKELAKVAGLL
ncbi:MAG TPA: orotidine-5'-phosphate decarboxylase [Limnochordia bacterium]|nr:orotidine-5'-phosphate decarboxylase [Limnochordia bacterium]